MTPFEDILEQQPLPRVSRPTRVILDEDDDNERIEIAENYGESNGHITADNVASHPFINAASQLKLFLGLLLVLVGVFQPILIATVTEKQLVSTGFFVFIMIMWFMVAYQWTRLEIQLMLLNYRTLGYKLANQGNGNLTVVGCLIAVIFFFTLVTSLSAFKDGELVAWLFGILIALNCILIAIAILFVFRAERSLVMY